MNLDRLQVVLKPRSTWQTMDLGITVGKHFFLPLFMISLSMTALLTAVFYTLSFDIWITILLLFWFKPIIERPILFYLSRSIFSDAPSFYQLITQMPSILFRQGLKTFTYRRIGLSRSFNDPVVSLEGLDKSARQQRLQVLHKIDTGSSWLSILGILIELLIQVSLYLAPVIMLPSDFIDWSTDDGYALQSQTLDNLLTILSYAIAVSLVAPFYVSCGFMLYLNCRTKLEAWHLELGFKKIAQRFSTLIPSIALIFCFFIAPQDIAFAQTQATESEQTTPFKEKNTYPLIDNQEANAIRLELESILASDLFGEHYQEKEYHIDWDLNWNFDFDQKDSNLEKPEYPWLAFIQDLALYFKYFIILCLAGLLIFVLFKFRVWQYFKQFSPLKTAKPKTVMGMAVNKDSLPKQAYDAISTHIENQEMREALSLMFRCHISQAIHHQGIPFKNSHTEQECLALIREYRPENEAMIFSRMTQLWLNLAYAHEELNPEDVRSLLDAWYPLVEEYLQQ